ncbi:MAG: YidB family protein [Beijerinckiaceae bacterium]
MGMFDNALKNAVPGGNLATPIAVAVGALLLGQLFSGRSSAPAAAPASPSPAAPSPQGGDLFGGLSALVQKFQNGGLAETVNSWIGQGQNAPIQPGQLGSVLGQQTISDLARQSGVSEQELLEQLAKVLPNVVNHLTPNGRLPTQAELQH